MWHAWHQVATARESVSRGQLRTGPGTCDRDFGLACYRKRVTGRSPDSKLGEDTYWARALSCALSCSVSWELVLVFVLALFASCVLGAAARCAGRQACFLKAVAQNCPLEMVGMRGVDVDISFPRRRQVTVVFVLDLFSLSLLGRSWMARGMC